jgi:hypothetical protein
MFIVYKFNYSLILHFPNLLDCCTNLRANGYMHALRILWGVLQLSLWVFSVKLVGGDFCSILISLNVVLTYVPLENYDL